MTARELNDPTRKGEVLTKEGCSVVDSKPNVDNSKATSCFKKRDRKSKANNLSGYFCTLTNFMRLAKRDDFCPLMPQQLQTKIENVPSPLRSGKVNNLKRAYRKETVHDMQVLCDRILVYLGVRELFRITKVRTVLILRTRITVTVYLAQKKESTKLKHVKKLFS